MARKANPPFALGGVGAQLEKTHGVFAFSQKTETSRMKMALVSREAEVAGTFGC